MVAKLLCENHMFLLIFLRMRSQLCTRSEICSSVLFCMTLQFLVAGLRKTCGCSEHLSCYSLAKSSSISVPCSITSQYQFMFSVPAFFILQLINHIAAQTGSYSETMCQKITEIYFSYCPLLKKTMDHPIGC